MDLRQLRAFIEVVRHGGFSEAARHIFASQSAVSKAVKQLEDEIGIALLDRTRRGVALTAAGEIVQRRAQAMLGERDDLLRELDELRGLRRGVLRLGLPPLGSSFLFAPLFAIYRQRYPAIDIRLVEHGSRRLEQVLLAGEVDIAASLLPVDPIFDWFEVKAEPLMALVQASHPTASKKTLDLAVAAQSPFLLFEEGFALNQMILDACARIGHQPSIAARSGQIDFIIELVNAGLGIAFLPRIMAQQRRHPQVRALFIRKPEIMWRMALIWRRGAFLPFAASAWIDLTKEKLGAAE